ncbi:MAG: hypothetical protein L3J79_12890 [Candidatus Marinimicrobia bacterium]|nr:hypothetical protein [Candidatus Neomarinimicrobiota bacterium]
MQRSGREVLPHGYFSNCQLVLGVRGNDMPLMTSTVTNVDLFDLPVVPFVFELSTGP